MYCLLKPQLKKILRCLTRIKLKYFCGTIALLVILDVYGVFTHIFEESYPENFVYPYEGDIQPFVEALRRDKKPDVEPINVYNYTYLHNPKNRCDDPGFRTLRIVFLVKSSANHFERREGIRSSWGYGNRFFDVPTRLVFLLGTNPWDENLARSIKAESEKHNDILQADFIDTYYNNTIKTMTGFKWAVNYCKNAKFYMFVDDDMYVSVKNILSFVRNPASYPDYLREPGRMAARKREIKESDSRVDSGEDKLDDENRENDAFSRKITESTAEGEKISTDDRTLSKSRPNHTRNNNNNNNNNNRRNNTRVPNAAEPEILGDSIEKPANDTVKREKRQVFDLELPDDVRLYAGSVFPSSSPARHKISRWYVPLEEYPYHLWPPYITAGAYVLSKEGLIDLYYASLYTKHFRFDDIFLGIVAKKADIEMFHCDEFYFHKKDYTRHNYKYVLTSHGYDDPRELVSVWQEQKSLGNA